MPSGVGSELCGELGEVRIGLGDVRERLDRLGDEVTELRGEVVEQGHRHDRVDGRLNSLTKDVESLSREMRELRTELPAQVCGGGNWWGSSARLRYRSAYTAGGGSRAEAKLQESSLPTPFRCAAGRADATEGAARWRDPPRVQPVAGCGNRVRDARQPRSHVGRQCVELHVHGVVQGLNAPGHGQQPIASLLWHPTACRGRRDCQATSDPHPYSR